MMLDYGPDVFSQEKSAKFIPVVSLVWSEYFDSL